MDAQPTADIVELVARAGAATHPIVAAVRPDQWGLPTPCSEWDVRAVARHLIHGGAMYLAALEAAGNAPAAPASGGDPADAALAAALHDIDARLLAAMREPGAMARTIQLPFGPLPAATAAGYRFVDLLVHGWDIAKATGQPTDFAPDLNDAALAMSRAGLEHVDRAAFAHMFAAEHSAPAGASAADRLAAFLGRAV